MFVAVVPASTPLPLDKGVGLEHFHDIEVLNKVTIGHQSGKGRKTQYSFCGYCGVRIQNTETCLNHVQAHLHLHLVCGGCRGCYSETHGNMSGHINKCQGVKNLKEQEQKALLHLWEPMLGSWHTRRGGGASPLPTEESGPLQEVRSTPNREDYLHQSDITCSRSISYNRGTCSC